MDQVNLLNLLYADNIEFSAYRERKFANEHKIRINYQCANTYNHIKQHTRNYLMFDIDNIKVDKVYLLFNNDFFIPNFYVYEYSKTKQCYTLQVFLLLNHEFKPDNIKDMYKKLCLLFGADTQYQIKTGIHKNPSFYEYINIDELNIKIPNKSHCGYIHGRTYNFEDIYNNLEYFGYFDNIDNIDYFDDYDSFFTGLDCAENEPKEDLSFSYEKVTVKVNAISEFKKHSKKKTDKEVGTRNVMLFEKTRLIAYGMSDQSLETILHIANKINSEFSIPLKDKEVIKVVKSIYKFITQEFGKTKADPYSERQRAKSIEVRKNEAIHKIKIAIIALQRSNKNITASAIKTKTKQNINTIKNNFNEAFKQAEAYNNRVIQKQLKEEKRSKKEFKQLCRTLSNKPIRTRSQKRNTKALEPAKIAPNPISKSIPADLMPSFDTSCDFIFNRR